MAAGRIKGITFEIGGDTTKDPVLGAEKKREKACEKE